MSFRLSFELKDDLVSALSILLDSTDKYRMTGRSSIMAKAYIVIAYRNPYTWINIVDHVPNARSGNSTARIIQQIYADHEYFEYAANRIKYVPKKINEPLGCLFKNPDITENFGLNDYYR